MKRMSIHAPQSPQKGFTLIELIMTLAIVGICASALVAFIRPSVNAYLDVRNRSSLTADAQAATRTIAQDVRSAVPNSIRTPGPLCVETVPTTSGGSYRTEPDSVNDTPAGCSAGSTCSASVDTSSSATTSVFDVLSTLQSTPAVGDQVVINNQVASQVHSGSNRAAITSVSTPRSTDGTLRLGIAPTQFPLGYTDGRFVVVPASGPVTYVCDGADGTVDANGDGKGILYRRTNYGFSPTLSSCPASASLSGAAVVARRVKSCTFSYSPNQGATEQNGYLSIAIELTRNNETVGLVSGAHIDNAP
jgi:MSHA biogenesis protein MshO